MSMENLWRLKIKLGIQGYDNDLLLGLLMDEAEEYILGYTKRNREQWLPVFDGVQAQIAAINYGRLGAEGVQGRSEGDVSTTFYGSGHDYPDSVTKTLNPYRLIKGV